VQIRNDVGKWMFHWLISTVRVKKRPFAKIGVKLQ